MSFKLFKTFIFCFSLCFIAQESFSQILNSKKVDLPATYTFDYNYKLKMTTQSQKKDMVMDYYLKKDAEYFGFKMDQIKTEQGDMFFVMDNNLDVNAMFMDMMGQKMVQTTSLNMKEMTKDTVESNKDFNIKKIGTKTILGFECQGFVIDNDEAEITFYIAENAPVSFNNMMDANLKNMPKGFNTEWMKKMENGLMMEMIYKDKKKSKNDMTMTCIALNKTDFSIKTSDYKSSIFGR
jgi:hypothetical protein